MVGGCNRAGQQRGAVRAQTEGGVGSALPPTQPMGPEVTEPPPGELGCSALSPWNCNFSSLFPLWVQMWGE